MKRTRRTGGSRPVARRTPSAVPELHELRSAIANVRAAAEALDAAGPLPDAAQAALLNVVLGEAERASQAVDDLGRAPADVSPPRHRVETAARFAAALAVRCRAAHGLELATESPGEEQVAFTPAIETALVATLGRLRRELGVGEARLSVRARDSLVSFELAFELRTPSVARLAELPTAALADEDGAASLVDATHAAGGEAWLAMRRGEPTLSLRLLLPRA